MKKVISVFALALTLVFSGGAYSAQIPPKVIDTLQRIAEERKSQEPTQETPQKLVSLSDVDKSILDELISRILTGNAIRSMSIQEITQARCVIGVLSQMTTKLDERLEESVVPVDPLSRYVSVCLPD